MTDPVSGAGRSSGATEVGDADGTRSATYPPGPILPQPTRNVSGDDLMVLRKLLVKMSESSMATGKAKIERNQQLVAKAIEEAFEARKREAENRREDGGFFEGIATAAEALTVDLAKLKNVSDPFGAVERSLDKAGAATIDSRQFWADLEKGAIEVAKWGAVAGSTALAIGSFGAATPIAALAIVGAVMSCAAASDSTFHILERCGVDKETAMWIDVGLCVGGALCGGGSGVAQMLSTQSTQVGAAIRAGAIIADATAGASATAAGVAHIEVAAFERDAKLAEADAQDAEMTQRRIERRIQQTLDAIRETFESCDRGKRRVGEAINKEAATNVVLVRA